MAITINYTENHFYTSYKIHPKNLELGEDPETTIFLLQFLNYSINGVVPSAHKTFITFIILTHKTAQTNGSLVCSVPQKKSVE